MRNIEHYALDQYVIVVAVEGDVGDWAAYIGKVAGHCHEHGYQAVLRSGSKLEERIAKAIFPHWADKHYRR